MKPNKKKVPFIIATAVAIFTTSIFAVAWFFMYQYGQEKQQTYLIKELTHPLIDTNSRMLELQGFDKTFSLIVWQVGESTETNYIEILENWLEARFWPLLQDPPQYKKIKYAPPPQPIKLYWFAPTTSNPQLSEKLPWRRFLGQSPDFLPAELIESQSQVGLYVIALDGQLVRSYTLIHDTATLQKTQRAISRSFHHGKLYEFLHDVPMLKERVLGIR